jgi:hypothetical protein
LGIGVELPAIVDTPDEVQPRSRSVSAHAVPSHLGRSDWFARRREDNQSRCGGVEDRGAVCRRWKHGYWPLKLRGSGSSTPELMRVTQRRIEQHYCHFLLVDNNNAAI